MKKIILFIICSFVTTALLAQAPQAFKYQAIARDEAGNILSNWKIGLKVSIIQGDQNGQEVYMETHQVTSNIYGMINLEIGKGNVQKGNFNIIAWGQSSYSIRMEMDIAGGTNYKEIGTSQLYAVPYALYAEQAGTILQQETDQSSNHRQSPSMKQKPNSGNRNGTPNTKFPANTSSFMNVNAGNVGIGTTDPQEKLDVIGNVKANRMILTDANGNQWEIVIDTTGTMQLIDKFIECGDSLYDYRNGQYYQTVLIGIQCWMAQNLNIGTRINSTTGGQQQTDNDTIEKYCYNNQVDNCDVYGGLYEWEEMMQYATTEGAQGICPDSWHIPTDGEWTTLTEFLGGSSEAGGKMKSTGTIGAGTGLWHQPNTGATNESGFTGLPGGSRTYSSGSFGDLGDGGYFWSSSQNGASSAWSRSLGYNGGDVYRNGSYKTRGFSVRCLQDGD